MGEQGRVNRIWFALVILGEAAGTSWLWLAPAAALFACLGTLVLALTLIVVLSNHPDREE